MRNVDSVKKTTMVSESWDIYNEISFKIMMLRIRWYLFRMEQKSRILRIIHCNRGWHKYRSGSLKYGKQLPCKRFHYTLNISYLRCKNCDSLCFFSTKDKEKYLAFKKQELGDLQKLVEIMVKPCKENQK
jgi:hypothetical protein